MKYLKRKSLLNVRRKLARFFSRPALSMLLAVLMIASSMASLTTAFAGGPKELIEGEAFIIPIDTQGLTLTLDIPLGLTWQSGGTLDENGLLVLEGEVDLEFVAVAGDYTLTLMDEDGIEVESISFTVVLPAAPPPEEGSISGFLWLDANADGTYDSGEAALGSYPVHLYLESDTANIVETVTTGADGHYIFENLEPNTYVAGINPNELGADRYLFPLVGIANDNMFKVADDWESVISDPVSLAAGEAITGIDAGMRNPMGIVPTASGDVSLLSFTIANSASGAENDTGVTYNTYASNTNQVTVRGIYHIDRDAVTDALVSITLTNKDVEGYFGAAGNFNYFTTNDGNVTFPMGSGNQTVTPTTDGVTVSFTVSGNTGSSASFTIGFGFDRDTFAGWIPNGKALAEITSGGDVVTPATLTVTAAVADSTVFVFNKSPVGDIGIDNEMFLGITSNFYSGNSSQWKLKPGTDVQMTLEYDDGAIVSIPSTPYYGTTPAGTIDIATPGVITWDLGEAGTDGRVESSRFLQSGVLETFSYLIPYQPLSIVYPSGGSFAVGETVTVNARLEYTLVGQSTPTIREIPLTANIVDGFIHMAPDTLAFSGIASERIYADIDDAKYSYGQIIEVIGNAGTLPVPNTCLTWYNDVEDSGNKTNVRAIVIRNYNVRCKNELTYFINGGTPGSRTVKQYVGAGLVPGADVTITPAAAGVSLGAGEYIEKIELRPLLNDVTELNATTALAPQYGLPVNAGFRMVLQLQSWPTAGDRRFPNNTPIQLHDVTSNRAELSWEGESKPALHISSTVVNKTPDSVGTGTTVLMRTSNTDVFRNVYWTRNSTWPVASFAFQSGESGSKAPGAPVGVYLRMYNDREYSYEPWIDPVIYYIPPEYIEIDTTQTLEVYNNSDGSLTTATASMTEITLDGQRAYKIEITGLSLAPDTYYTNNYRYIPLTLKVKDGTLPGSYYMYNRNGTQGLLFGTTNAAHSILYAEDYNLNNLFDDSTRNLDGNTQTHHLITSNSPSLTVSSLDKLDVIAEMFNNVSGNGWQNTNTPGAQATVNTSITGKGEFRFILKNSGNTYVGDIRLLDILPFFDTTNEKTVLNPTAAKGSEWTAPLKSAPVVTILDADGNDVTSSFTGGWSFQYDTNGDPSYNGNHGINGIQRTGGATFANNGTYATAQSFLMLQNATFRLPPGHSIVITGTVEAPTGVTTAMVNKVAYNAFAVQSQYYTAATGGTGVPASLVEPTKQKFILLDMGNAVISKHGFVFKDLDNDGVFGVGDVKYEGVSVQLWDCDASGVITTTNPREITTTDANGQYEFTDLPAGTYIIKVIKPAHSPYDPYAFVAKGTDGNAAHSHVDATGLATEVITLSASDSQPAPTNAGIKATGRVTVSYYAMVNGTKTSIGTVKYQNINITADTAAVTGNITAGSAGFEIPTNYHLVTGETTSKGYSVSWSDATDEVEFEVELDANTVSYVYTGTPPTGVPDVPTAAPQDVGSQVYVSSPAPTFDGYTFSGWKPTIASGITVGGGHFTMPNNAVEFEGSWTAKTVSIEYLENVAGSTGPLYTGTGTYDQIITAPSDPTRTGYTFGGWYKEGAATNAWTFATDTLTVANGVQGASGASPHLDLYAKWTANTYTISFAANGGDNTMADQTATYDQNLTLTSNAFTRTGFTFTGWNTTTDGLGTPYANSQAFTPWNTTSGLTLYAQWTAIPQYAVTYTVTSDEPTPVSGMPSPLSKDEYQGSTVAVAANPTTTSTTKGGVSGTWVFSGWTTTDATVSGGSFTMPGNPVAFSGTWTFTATPTPPGPGPDPQDPPAVTYTVTFVDWDGSEISSSQVERGGSATAPADPTREGYTFTGWNGDYSNVTSNVTVTAQYRENPKAYTVTFVDWDGSEISASQVEHGGSATAPADPTREGYTFTGWSGDYSNVTSDITVTAQYQENPAFFTVTFVDWDNSVLGSSQVPRGGSATAPTSPTRDGYTFTGWDRDFSNVTSNIIVTAQYSVITTQEPPTTNPPTTEPPTTNPPTTNPPTTEPPTTEPPTTNPPTTNPPTTNPPTTTTPSTTTPAQATEETPDDESLDNSDPTGGLTSEPIPDSREEFTQDEPTYEELFEIIEAEEIPLFTIMGTPIPLFSGSIASEYVWALVNLILAIAGIILALITFLRIITQKRNEKDDEHDQHEGETAEEREKRKTRRWLWIVVTVIMGIVGLAVFLLTEDMTKLMVMVDYWTIVNAIIFILEVVSFAFAFKRAKGQDDEPDPSDTPEQQPVTAG